MPVSTYSTSVYTVPETSLITSATVVPETIPESTEVPSTYYSTTYTVEVSSSESWIPYTTSTVESSTVCQTSSGWSSPSPTASATWGSDSKGSW